MALIRSIIHMLWMAITVVPYALAIVLGSLFGMRGTSLYPHCPGLAVDLCAQRAGPLLGIQRRVTGMEHLPQGEKSGAVLLQAPVHVRDLFDAGHHAAPLAYVFKKELLYVPFFGWAIGRLDMIHIDRSLRAKAFNKVVQQGKALLAKGTWVIMFPEGTRMERGRRASTRTAAPPGHRHRRARDSDCRHIGQGVAPQGLHQKPGVVDVSIGPAIASAGASPTS